MSSASEDGDDHQVEPTFQSGYTEHERRLNALRRSASDEQPLYGRDREWTQLIEAYRKATSPRSNEPSTSSQRKNMVLIRGSSGVGKSALAQKLKRETQADGGWFISGKFDILQQATPYSAFIQAFSEFARLLTNINNENEKLISLRKAIREIVRNPEILTNVIPDLSLLRLSDEQLEGVQRPVKRQADVRVVRARFLTTFRNFVRAIGSLGCPLVVLLDDVHWAGEGSLELLRSLVDDAQIQRVLFVCTCVSKMPRLETYGPEATNELLLSGLTARETQQALTTFTGFRNGSDTVVNMSECLHRAADGNCAFIRHLLLLLEESTNKSHEGKDLDEQSHYLNQVCNEEGLTMEHVVRKRILLLPKDVQDVLAYSAFVGCDIHESILCKLLRVETVEPYLQEAQIYGLIRYIPERDCYKFCHDSIQAALLGTVPSEAHAKRHLAIGRQLWKSILKTQSDSEDAIFVVLDQIRRGEELLVDLEEKMSISTLCLVASERAVTACSFRTAVVYLELGIRLSSPFWVEQPDLNLALHNACCEVHFVLGEFDRTIQLIEAVEEHSRSVEDELRAQSMRVYILAAGRRNMESIDVGLKTLQKIGSPIPSNPRVFQVLKLQRKAQQLLKGKSDEALMKIPMMVDKEKLACMKILNVMFVSGYYSTSRLLLPTLILQMVCLTLEYGLSSMAPVAFAAYGGLHITRKRFSESRRFGKLALALLDRLDAVEFQARVYSIVYFFVFPWSLDFVRLIGPLKRGFLVALETGDVEYATTNAGMHLFVLLDAGTSLVRIRQEIVAILGLLENRAQNATLYVIKSLYQLAKKIMEPSDEPSLLKGDVLDGEAAIQELHELSNNGWHLWIRYHMCMLAYISGDFARAESCGREAMVLLTRRPMASVDMAMTAVFNGLASLSAYQQHPDESRARSRRKYLSGAQRSLRCLRFLSSNSPHNALGLLKLLEAEYFATTGKHKKAVLSFRLACGVFTEKGFTLGRAIGHEQWARCIMRKGGADQEEWEEHIRTAHGAYKEWGALVKVGCLVAEFPFLNEEEASTGRRSPDSYLAEAPVWQR